MTRLCIFLNVTVCAIYIIGFSLLASKFPSSLGGSIIFILLLCLTIPFTLIIKKNLGRISMIQLLFVGMLAMNYMSFLEISGKVEMNNRYYMHIAFFCYLFFVYLFLYLIRSPFKSMSQMSNEEYNLFSKKVAFPLLAPSIAFGIVFNLFGTLLLIASYEFGAKNFILKYPFLRLSYVATAWLIIGFVITIIYMPKSYEDEKSNLFMENKLPLKSYSPKILYKYGFLLILVSAILGSILEIMRGNWIMWSETLLLISLMFYILWTIYKNMLQCPST